MTIQIKFTTADAHAPFDAEWVARPAAPATFMS